MHRDPQNTGVSSARATNVPLGSHTPVTYTGTHDRITPDQAQNKLNLQMKQKNFEQLHGSIIAQVKGIKTQLEVPENINHELIKCGMNFAHQSLE